MRFAVVEYSSRSGQIWRDTPERPNYLADPIKEIDPTSFGCYVSALHGEHIPLLALIKPNIVKKLVKRLSGRWPDGYDISYLEKFDVLMVVHQISDGQEMTRLVRRLKHANPAIRILGVPTQPFGILRDYWQSHQDWLSDLKEFMNYCDIFLTIVASTQPDWQAMTNTPVKYLSQPYPVEYALRYWQPRSAKKPIIFVAGVADRDNIKRGQSVAAQIQRRLPQYEIEVTNTPGAVLDTANLSGARYQVVPFQLWQEHLRHLADIALVVNTDFTQTRGRVQVDCAAVGTPSIGANSDGQQDLFPDLAATPSTPENQMLEQAVRLLSDNDYYEKITREAKISLGKYNYEQSAQRLNELIASL